MPEVLPVENFLDKLENENLLLLDVRSEKEFGHATIPGAVNIPLLNNEHRHLVGIEYKKNGREAAVAMGFELVSPHFHEFIKKANELTDKKEVMIYCWRGGMRSSIMGWILSMAGFKVTLLKGGYKFFRRFIIEQFGVPKKIIVLGGHTGCGKTEVLHELKKKGEQVVDLEALANHRGSAFGNVGLPPQPSNEFFENLLGLEWKKADPDKVIWLEAESRSIGHIKIPDELFSQLQSAPLIEMICSNEIRKENILKIYGAYPKSDLMECTAKLKKRLGNLRLTEALKALDEDRWNDWLDMMITYYDKYYSHSLTERTSTQRIQLELKSRNDLENFVSNLIKISNTSIEKSFA